MSPGCAACQVRPCRPSHRAPAHRAPAHGAPEQPARVRCYASWREHVAGTALTGRNLVSDLRRAPAPEGSCEGGWGGVGRQQSSCCVQGVRSADQESTPPPNPGQLLPRFGWLSRAEAPSLPGPAPFSAGILSRCPQLLPPWPRLTSSPVALISIPCHKRSGRAAGKHWGFFLLLWARAVH